jgi:hypothetical protein
MIDTKARHVIDRHSNFDPGKAVVESHLFMKGETHKTRPHVDITRQKSATLVQILKEIVEGKRHCKKNVD